MKIALPTVSAINAENALLPETKKLQMASSEDQLPWLDGLRGLASFWVFVSHALILSGMTFIPILSSGGLAVDLFMMLSGFLMTHHYLLRRQREPWGDVHTWRHFWSRRFFRIAPLYYVLLFIALAMGPYLGEMRDAIAQYWPHTATAAERYHDSSFGNILTHLSFVFGALPKYAFATPLPDWSIGLEMQFYLAFPFLMLLLARYGAFRVGALLIVVCLLSIKAFHGYFNLYAMPSFLPMKLHIFFIGIWLAIKPANQNARITLLAGVMTAVVARWFSPESWFDTGLRSGIVVIFFFLLNQRTSASFSLPGRIASFARKMLSTRPAVFLGDTSYGFYLIHLLVLLPVAGHLTSIPAYRDAPGLVRFLLCILFTAPIAYAFSWVLHRLVEIPGIRMGKSVHRQIKNA